MRKNLTISLSLEDWQRVHDMVQSLGETYSRIFHRLIESSTAMTPNNRRIRKYRALLAPHGAFLARRAHLFAKARKRSATPS